MISFNRDDLDLKNDKYSQEYRKPLLSEQFSANVRTIQTSKGEFELVGRVVRRRIEF